MGRYNRHVRLHADMIQADRWQINRSASIRFWSSAAIECVMINVSRFGCRVHVAEPLAANQTIWLELDGCDPLHAKVIWSENCFAGCQFDTPLSEAAYAGIISASLGPDRFGDEIYI